MRRKILVVVAHPDDEVLGCGGTMAKMSQGGADVYTAILGEGIASRHKRRHSASLKNSIRDLRNDAIRANGILGVKETFLFDFPDNQFDTVAMLDIIRQIEGVKIKIRPDTVFTHHRMDLNIDHRITYEAVMAACRPIKGESVKDIRSFEVLSSTEWAYPVVFSPNIFVDIRNNMHLKLKAMASYKSEIRQFPHPRSLMGIKVNAAYWGLRSGHQCAEAFENIRSIE